MDDRPEVAQGGGVKMLYMTPGSPCQNGDNESFDGSLRNELLNGKSSLASPKPGCGSRRGGLTQDCPSAAAWATAPPPTEDFSAYC